MYADLKEMINEPKRKIETFDTSDYPQNNVFGFKIHNKKVLGAMKDECCGKIMTKFIGIRPKCYSFQCQDNKLENKSKGTCRNVTENLTYEEYLQSLLDRNLKIYKTQSGFRSRLHEIYTETYNKVALNSDDEKRYILSGNIDSLAWGHRDIPQDDQMFENVL